MPIFNTHFYAFSLYAFSLLTDLLFGSFVTKIIDANPSFQSSNNPPSIHLIQSKTSNAS
jgi:hypothetical protein